VPRDPGLEKIPSGITLHCMFPAEEGTKAVCVWEAGSVDEVRSFVDGATAGLARTTTSRRGLRGDRPATGQYSNSLKAANSGVARADETSRRSRPCRPWTHRSVVVNWPELRF
jgi:hypothetical protein